MHAFIHFREIVGMRVNSQGHLKLGTQRKSTGTSFLIKKNDLKFYRTITEDS